MAARIRPLPTMGENEEEKRVEQNVKIVDLSAGRRARQPTWLVRRAAQILVDNADQLRPEELRTVAEILMREAGSRLVLGEER